MAAQALGPEAYRDLVRRALEEDLGQGDASSRATIDEVQQARGSLVAKSPLVVAGVDVAAEVFHQLDPASVFEVRWGDGAHVQAGDVVALVSGRARALLAAERTALNFLQRLSGIATLTARCVHEAGGRITILDTRKTTPTLRALEKYAVRCGGGTNHRQRLDEALLVKDNHKRLAGGVRQAVARALTNPSGLSLEVEVETLEELDVVLALNVSRILLDNFTTYDIREAIRRIDGRAEVEISGGVTLDRIAELSTTGAEYVSIGALTHSAPAADLSLELEPL
ncbi:MAG: carboxylating nicotinate-nucleotide diphosphorylase [Vicinamibacterales bacterium]